MQALLQTFRTREVSNRKGKRRWWPLKFSENRKRPETYERLCLRYGGMLKILGSSARRSSQKITVSEIDASGNLRHE
jgi:hypothetical protein